jgi:rhodanese-related sulfurtransferase
MDEIPEISVQELAEKLRSESNFVLLDVREAWETNLARINDSRTVFLPMSQIARERKEAFPAELRDPQAEFVVLCHHGIRSTDVTRWMKQQGWQSVCSLSGGIADYAESIDPSVGTY